MRNNPKSHRATEANQKRTQKVIETYLGKKDLLATWEKQSDDVQIKEHDNLLELRRKIRNLSNYIAHRATPDSDL